MNIPINNIKNCDNLSSDEIKNLKNKLKINNDNDDNNHICPLIRKKYNQNYPCNITLYDDTKLTIKKHQLNVANHLINDRGAIVVHSVGTGKTLLAIATAQCLLLKKEVSKIIVVTPTSLQENFKKQMKMYNKKINDINYYFYTIQSLVIAIENEDPINCSDALVIIDEAHNIRTLDGTRFNFIEKYIKKAKKVLLLTATPLINYKYDIINLVSLIRGQKPITIDQFNLLLLKENKKLLEEYLNNIFSFYIKDSSKPDINFPTKKINEIFLVMDDKYLRMYENIEKGNVAKIPDFSGKNINVFYNGVRRASNIIDNKSPKIDWIIEKILDHPKLKFVIFSHFINMGIKPIMKELDKYKIKYSHVTGDINIKKRQEAVDNYNDNKISVLFISKAGSEGLDLKNTSFIIILEPAWNENSIEQIIGRGVRYKSHASLPESKRNVIIYKLYLVKPIEYKNLNKITNNNYLDYKGEILSVDLYLRNYSWLKQQQLITFFKLLQKFKFD
jgi:superfamily II DNA or RNA helicase